MLDIGNPVGTYSIIALGGLCMVGSVLSEFVLVENKVCIDRYKLDPVFLVAGVHVTPIFNALCNLPRVWNSKEFSISSFGDDGIEDIGI